MTSHKKLIIHTDGGARGNPGPAGIGVVIADDKKKVINEIAEYIGETTNNQAEYRAVLRAMEEAKKLDAEELVFYLDSELVVKQLKLEYKVKNKELAPLFFKIYNLSQQFKKVTFFHVRREFNKAADLLVNKAVDKYLNK
ncbi:MAG: ribonuclease HI family protein [bacterium]|nr:ribonuclease HI family protein [bacterium]